MRKSLLTLATLARHDGQQCRVYPLSLLCLLHSLSASPQHLAKSHQCPCWRPRVNRAMSNLNPSITQRQPWGRERGGWKGRNGGMSAGKKGGAVRVKYSHQSALSHLISPLSQPPRLPLLAARNSNSYRVWSQLSGRERDSQLILIKRFTDLNTCLRRGDEDKERRGQKESQGEQR